MQRGVKGVTHGWGIKIKHSNGLIKCNINHEMAAQMLFLNKNYKKKKGSKLIFVAFY